VDDDIRVGLDPDVGCEPFGERGEPLKRVGLISLGPGEFEPGVDDLGRSLVGLLEQQGRREGV
jgi:hypothetical protein